ncbi:GAF domain-containing sensor histidine kinase [Halorarius litoreus]|uniref:GAF domain-containing sensor histidine kinase n=1 Tax=Halorarius litoreus TaxID=2962676 RepID=UPI0020CEDDDA|nr:GAF domain-containing sensor histidine kinase [Halorarius litoreus]
MDGDADALRGMMDITSGCGTFEEKVESLLRLGCTYLDVEVGFLTRITDDRQRILAAVGDHERLRPGQSCPLSESYCRRTIENEGSLTVQHASIEGWENDAAYGTFGLESYVGARVEMEDDLYGTFCFADTDPHDEPFSESEVVFVELMAEWTGHELARQEMTTALQRERDRLEEFAGVVSHDLRNPLSVAVGELELAETHPEGDHLTRASDALDRMDELLSDLLAMAKAGETIGSRDATPLSEAAARSWETVETGAATLRTETTNVVSADPVRLAQVFENLFRNAVEHGSTGNRPGSSLTVTVRDIDGGFAVDDDGPGIPLSERSAVTEAGYTTNDAGTGFGLQIVDQIAWAHGWTLHVGESPSGGARFAFTDVETVGSSPEPVGASDA